MKSKKDTVVFVFGALLIIAGYLISIFLTGIKTDEERFDKFGTLLLILGGIVASVFFSRQISYRT